LIADGVQSIDDEFLEWFVKNPSCEFVETKISRYKHYYKTGEIMTSLSPTPDFSSRNMQCEKVQPIYKIIIPQEEPKFSEDEFEMQSRIINKVWDEESKQETLEEVAKKYSELQAGTFTPPHKTTYQQGFEDGAKWQSERMYSEEEVLSFGKSCFYKGFDKAENDDANCYTAFREEIGRLFEQFKK
jgi:hypothetical protein